MLLNPTSEGAPSIGPVPPQDPNLVLNGDRGRKHIRINFLQYSASAAAYVTMALCMGDHRVGDTSGLLPKPQKMGLARRGFSSGASSPS